MSELNDGSGAQSKRRSVIKNPPYAPSDSAVNTYIDEEKADKGENVEGVDLEDVIRRDGWAYSKSVDSLLERWSVVREWVIRHRWVTSKVSIGSWMLLVLLVTPVLSL